MEWTSEDQRTTLVILISGKFRVDLTSGSKTMSRQGDYVMWAGGIDHTWVALRAAVVSQAPGRAGMPSRGQVRSARANVGALGHAYGSLAVRNASC